MNRSCLDYDPTTGTFLTRDPLDGLPGRPDQANPYDYAHNDPLNNDDPLGLRPRDAQLAGTQVLGQAQYPEVDEGIHLADADPRCGPYKSQFPNNHIYSDGTTCFLGPDARTTIEAEIAAPGLRQFVGRYPVRSDCSWLELPGLDDIPTSCTFFFSEKFTQFLWQAVYQQGQSKDFIVRNIFCGEAGAQFKARLQDFGRYVGTTDCYQFLSTVVGESFEQNLTWAREQQDGCLTIRYELEITVVGWPRSPWITGYNPRIWWSYARYPEDLRCHPS